MRSFWWCRVQNLGHESDGDGCGMAIASPPDPEENALHDDCIHVPLPNDVVEEMLEATEERVGRIWNDLVTIEELLEAAASALRHS